ncbi:MAG: hypothetical protein R8G66_00975 [Cytophagales bacterium]|nr:hypothetical protein [Cytophagales bacterium]
MEATLLEWIGTIALASYFPVITFSFFKFRLARKQEELLILGERLQEASEQGGFDFKKNLNKEFAPGDYVLPLVFVTVITFLGMFLLLMGWTLYDPDSEGHVRSILWSGSAFWEMEPEIAEEKRGLAVVAFALLGSFLTAAQYIYRRYATVDLTPSNFFSVGIRMILSMVIALMISYLLSAELLSVSGETILILAFLTGVFPERGFKLLLSKVKQFQLRGDETAKNYSLDMIEGMNEMHKIRLNEVGVDNVQNLAQFDFLILVIKTPFPIRLLQDWVAQAKLIMEFQDDYKSLQKAGIRTILDFWDACEGKNARIKEIAAVTGVNELSIEVNFQNTIKDRSVALIKHFRD